jgi:hypothetical protein
MAALSGFGKAGGRPTEADGRRGYIRMTYVYMFVRPVGPPVRGGRDVLPFIHVFSATHC